MPRLVLTEILKQSSPPPSRLQFLTVLSKFIRSFSNGIGICSLYSRKCEENKNIEPWNANSGSLQVFADFFS